MSETLTLPPMMSGEEAPETALSHACQRAVLGCEAGLLSYRLAPSELQAALVFAPEVPLERAMAMLPLCGVAFQNALGALAPPEVAVHLEWAGGIRINGAACGRFQVIAADSDPMAVPDWLVVGFTLPLMPPAEDTGLTPDSTALFFEGCADVSPPDLLEVWARYVLNWITRWEADGNRPLHGEWRGLAEGIGKPVTQAGQTGHFLGVDDAFGMLIRDDNTTHVVPLTTVLETL